MPKFRTQRVSFAGSQGDRLDARLELPANEPGCFALVAHCFTCSKDYIAVTRISHALAERGIAVLRFDFTGLGNSEGDFANTNFSSNVADLICAADYLREHFKAPKILIGHSLGGAAMLTAAHQVPESVAIATIAAPSDPLHITQHFADQVPEVESRGEIEVEIAGQPFRIQKQFLDDIAGHRMKDMIGDLNRALLVLHSPRDTVVDIEHAERIFASARYPKSFILLDGADHLLTRREDAEYVASILAAWVTRFIDEPDKADAPAHSDSHGAVIVSEAGRGRFSQRISSRRHRLNADEPREYGGSDTGPTPYDLLLASLGSCTSMTLRMYAEHKQLPLQHVEVRLRHGKIHAQDCEDCESKEGRIDHIERVIEVQGDLDEAQRTKLLEVADKCAVHRTLHGEVRVTTRLGLATRGSE